MSAQVRHEVRRDRAGEDGSPGDAASAAAISVEFLGATFAGHGSRFATLREMVTADDRVAATFRTVSGWNSNSLLERAPLLPTGVKGRLRSAIEARGFATTRADAIWTSSAQAIQPWLWRQATPFARPLVLDLDWTLQQQEKLAPWYYGRRGRTGMPMRLARWREAKVWRAVSLFTPWSNWAAASLRDQGVKDARIHVLPPGIDLSSWRPSGAAREPGGRLRLLFVGNNLERKGADLVEAFVRRDDGFELDIVTGDDFADGGERVRVHRASPNSPELRALYQRADIFVMPSRAECFGIAYLEAMASGLPVVAGDTGGVRDIVVEGETGWVVRQTVEDLARVLRHAGGNRARLPGMGAAGRAQVEQRFDARTNAAKLVDELVAIVERDRARKRGRHGGDRAGRG